MNKNIYNLLLFLLLIVIFSCAFSKKNYQESFFVPKKVKEFYRPIQRNIRKNYEGFYDKSSKHISNMFKKFGIL
jgi:hypothetical protein